jgi:8-oxo-dGTP pyrophosphatase MutT (NUDIX family)
VLLPALLERLEHALAAPLPGVAAQTRMAPRPRREWPPDFDRSTIRHAAGLLLVYPHDQIAHIALTVRSERVRHGGQVSLPGGVVEPGESFEQTALRESHEEVALDPARVRLLGRLTPLDIPVSGFRLHPIVGTMAERPTLRPADAEVDRILEIPVPLLLDPLTVEWQTMTGGAAVLSVPVFSVSGATIWGATAMVLAEFLTLLGWEGPEQQRS